MSVKRRFFLLSFLVILLMILLNVRETPPLSPSSYFYPLESAIHKIYSPFFLVTRFVREKVSFVWSHYFDLLDARREATVLQAENDWLLLNNLSLKERLKNFEKKAEIFKSENMVAYTHGIAADVLSYDPMVTSQTVWISVGERDHVVIDSPVVTSKGLLGRIIKVLETRSQVLLVTDPRFAVDVIDESSRARALLVGSGADLNLKRSPFLSHLEYLKLGDDIKAGDLLLTSGLGEIYPMGIPVGNVLQMEKDDKDLFLVSKVLPVVDLTLVAEVLVLSPRHSFPLSP